MAQTPSKGYFGRLSLRPAHVFKLPTYPVGNFRNAYTRRCSHVQCVGLFCRHSSAPGLAPPVHGRFTLQQLQYLRLSGFGGSIAVT
jgi:hypothetical protein